MEGKQAPPLNKGQKSTVAAESDLDVDHGLALRDAKSKKLSPAFPLAAYLWPNRGTVSFKYGILMMLMVTTLYKWSTGLWPYSGMAIRFTLSAYFAVT